jgi:hypothetical protein
LTIPSKNQNCDYAPPCQPSLPPPEPPVLVLSHPICGHADLSPHGATELVRAVKAYIEAPAAGPATTLLELVVHILDSVNFDMSDALTRFGPAVQQWCPILLEDQILGNCDYRLSEPVNPQDGPRTPVLWLAMWLVLRKPCSPHENMGASELYAVVKQVHALMQTALELDLAVLQIGMIVAVYEIGHSLRQQAFQTLAICVATLTFLELEAVRKQDAEMVDVVGWLKASLAMIDRWVLSILNDARPLTCSRLMPLSMLSNPLPLTLSADHAISKSLRSTLGPGLPPVPARRHATSHFKVIVRTGAVISAGPALDYIYSRQHGSEHKYSYDQADAAVNLCISMFVVKPGSTAMFHCDAMPLTVWYVSYIFPCPSWTVKG